MKRIQTHINFNEYRMFFDLIKDQVYDDPWHVMLEAALDTLKNEYLAELVIAIDWHASKNIFTGQKVGKTTIVIMREYIKRVTNFEAAQAKLKAEENRLQAEAYAMIQKERIKLMGDVDEWQTEEELKERILWHGEQSLAARFENNRITAAYHDREASRVTEILQLKKKIRFGTMLRNF